MRHGRRPARSIAVAGALAATAVAGCHQYLDPRLYTPVNPRRGLLASELLEIRALGVQGFVVRVGDLAVLTPPLYSNPALATVLSGRRPLPVRQEQIAHFLRREWLADVKATVVGHSHYDHLMDLPAIYETFGLDAPIYGSRTAAHLLRAAGVPSDIALDLTRLGDGGPEIDAVDYRSCGREPEEGCRYVRGHAGAWVVPPDAGERIRIRALCSRHSSQVARLPVSSQGCEPTQPKRAPRSADDWKLGDTYAYLIDFLNDEGRVRFRVYYQDSPTHPEYGYPPQALMDAPVDVALLCAGAFDQVRDNPRGIVASTRPRYVLFGHWENFFRTFDDELQTLFTISLKRLRNRMDATRAVPHNPWTGEYRFAVPGSLYQFAPA